MMLSKLKIVAAAVLALALVSGGVTLWEQSAFPATGAERMPGRGSNGPDVPEERKPEGGFVKELGDRRDDLDLAWDDANLVWGEVVDGLQAGVGLIKGRGDARRLDEAVPLVVKVRNRSRVPVELTYQSQPFDDIPPNVESAEGKRLPVTMPPFDMHKRRTLERTLNPDEAWGTVAPGITVTSTKPNDPMTVLVESPTVAFPGFGAKASSGAICRVSYGGFLRNHPGLSTGRLELVIQPPAQANPTFHGRWQATRFLIDGKPDPADAVEKTELLIDDDSYRFAQVPPHGPRGLGGGIGTVRVDASRVPHEINLTPTSGVYKGLTQKGIFEVEGDTLKLCYGMPTVARPAEFATRPNSGIYLAEFRRVAGGNRPADDPGALVARVLRAHGGEARIRSLKAFTETIRETDDGGGATTTRHFLQPPDEYRCEIQYPGDERTLICILKAGVMERWHRHPDGKLEEARFLGLERPADYWLDAVEYFGPRGVLKLGDPEYKVTFLDEMRVEGRDTVGVRLVKATPTVKFDLKMRFDKTTGRLLSEENLLSGATTTYGDYQESGGVPVARRTTRSANQGTLKTEGEVVEFKSAERLDPDLFRKP